MAETASNSTDARTPLVLIVDDNPGNLQVLGSVLSGAEIDVAIATGGREALASVEEALPDLILLDLMMPGLDGLQVCRALKESERTCDVPVMFLTARHETDDVLQGFQAGAVDYVCKPFNAPELLARVRTHLELRLVKQRQREIIRELERAQADLKKKYDIICSDLALAKKIQGRMFPDDIDSIIGYAFDIRYLPVEDVGGDYFDICRLNNGVVRIMLADATGHGIQAALITMLIKSEYEKLKEIIRKPSEILELLNNVFLRTYRTMGILFTGTILDIHPGRDRLAYSSAGQTPALLLHEDRIEPLGETGRMIGVLEGERYRTVEHDLSAATRMLLYSDGLYEQFNAKGEMFGDERMIAYIDSIRTQPTGAIIDRLLAEVMRFRGTSERITRNDDITVIGVSPR